MDDVKSMDAPDSDAVEVKKEVTMAVLEEAPPVAQSMGEQRRNAYIFCAYSKQID